MLWDRRFKAIEVEGKQVLQQSQLSIQLDHQKDST